MADLSKLAVDRSAGFETRAAAAFRDVSEDELRQAVEAQGRWLATAGREGARLDLRHARIRDAELSGARLARAILSDSDLRGARLRGADLTGADLGSAILVGADLERARLREADLRGADLTGVAGLLSGQPAGTDLSGARLPAQIAAFDELDQVRVTAARARGVLLAAVAGCLYSWLTIAGAAVSTIGFTWTAPPVLLVLHLVQQVYLQWLWEGLAALPAVFPDGRSLDRRVDPWLVVGLLRAHVPRLQGERPFAWRLQVGLVILLAWALVPGTLLLLLLRHLPSADWPGITLLIVCLAAAVAAGLVFHRQAATTLSGRSRPD